MHYLKLKSPVVVLLLVLLQYTCALDIESAKEQTCFPINKTADVDLKWVNTINISIKLKQVIDNLNYFLPMCLFV